MAPPCKLTFVQSVEGKGGFELGLSDSEAPHGADPRLTKSRVTRNSAVGVVSVWKESPAGQLNSRAEI
jgi:hypothetical protein